MNVIDIAIILFILMGAVVGFKRGFTKELVCAVSFFIIIILSFILKNPVSIFLYEHLPFFKFGGILKGVTVLNIALYEIIAFLIVMGILTFILGILKKVTTIFEKILNFTIILGIPSKILGAIIGLVESFVWVFIILYILNLPFFHIKDLEESKYKNQILEKTPILSELIKDSVNVVNEFTELKTKYEETKSPSEFNRETLDLFLKYDVITVESVDYLVEKDKLKIDNIESILSKYREEA